VRLAEEVATLDQLSHGRLDLGIGRSSFPRAYEGYNIPYAESRTRFREYLEIMRLAWTHPRFSYTGMFYSCQDLEVIPKPYQQPHPPLHHAAAARETFAAAGAAGFALLVAVIGTALSELTPLIAIYQDAWRSAGHPGQGEVRLRLPIYVAETQDSAQADPRHSLMLAALTYEEVLRERVVVGTPKQVAGRLHTLQEGMGLSGFIIEFNVGGNIPPALVARSMRRFAQEVAPRLRQAD
jgi:alkanesulfonate monooxygenase SsuD/methylene tetrahydromethanopterin reductase-like flavin-dependent oxidoreductase (luciferase family)